MFPLILFGLGGGLLWYLSSRKKEPRLGEGLAAPWEIEPGVARTECELPSLEEIEAMTGGDGRAIVPMPDPEGSGAAIPLPAWAVFQSYQALANLPLQGPDILEQFALMLEQTEASNPVDGEGGAATANWLRSYRVHCVGA